MRKLFLAACAVAAISCRPTEKIDPGYLKATYLYYGVARIEDKENHIVCYTNYGHGISCLPMPTGSAK